MTKQSIFQIIIFIIGLAFLDPLDFLMPTPMQYIMLGLLVLALCLYGVFVFKEQVLDERDVVIRAFAHRVSYLFGMSGLVLIMLYHLIFMGRVYPEIVVLLLLLILVKNLATKYGEHNF